MTVTYASSVQHTSEMEEPTHVERGEPETHAMLNFSFDPTVDAVWYNLAERQNK